MKRLDHKKLVATEVKSIDGMVIVDDEIWGAACNKGVVRVKINNM